MSTECTGKGGRGCGCAWHEEKRPRAREYARRQRERELATRTGGSTRCQRRAGTGICNTLFDITVVGGRTITRCSACERRERGLCRDCPRRVEGTIGRALRCAEHKETARQAQMRASEERHREKYNAASRRYYQENPEVRRRRNEYKKAYRKAHPDKVRAQKRREALRQGTHRLEWHRRHNRKLQRALRKRQQAMLAYYRDHPTRPAPKCAGCTRWLDWQPLPNGRRGRPPKWCDDCAPKYEKQRRERTGRSIKACDEQPLLAYMPRLREIEKKVGGLRTCLTEGCDTVLTGRKKKCARCKARETEAARQLLANYTPRTAIGPRTATRQRESARRGAEYEHLSNRLANGYTIAELARELHVDDRGLIARLTELGGDLVKRAYANSQTPRPEWWKPAEGAA